MPLGLACRRLWLLGWNGETARQGCLVCGRYVSYETLSLEALVFERRVSSMKQECPRVPCRSLQPHKSAHKSVEQCRPVLSSCSSFCYFSLFFSFLCLFRSSGSFLELCFFVFRSFFTKRYVAALQTSRRMRPGGFDLDRPTAEGRSRTKSEKHVL